VSGDLIDTTEMYLRTIYELTEEGIVPLRARIAERLHQSGPTVSQTVARMERDGLLTVAEDRHLQLTDDGQTYATRVMRKHRLAERLLLDVIGLDWSLVHDEACRWEHVISDDVERRLVSILHQPTESPYGNPIPGLEELGITDGGTASSEGQPSGPAGSLLDVVPEDGSASAVTIVRIAEPLQAQRALMTALREMGATPGRVVEVQASVGGVLVRGRSHSTRLTDEQAGHLYVRAAD
jgi:DtxR family transcriptional regulator, Mn-dependent transcriptional regulator